ncbi:MAG TPA: c-type cytochrome [Novosphingobium sp.]
MFYKSMAAIGLLSSALATPAQAGEDPVRGAQVFRQRCGACHSVEPGKLGMGPNLGGVMGRAAAATRFPYSPAMKNAGGVWTDPRMDAFLRAPAALVRGNRMAFPGLSAAQDRADVIAFLKGAR